MTVLMEQGERPIRAHLRAERAATKKPNCLNEAVSNRTDEVLAGKNAETFVKRPENLMRSCGEAIRPEFRLSHIVDTLEEPNMIGVVASEHRLDLAACVGSRVAEMAVDAAQSVQAGNPLEKMLCHQMVAIHRAAMKLVARILEMHDQPVEMARLSNAAARAMQVYQEALLTLQKLRTSGKQTVVAQHVQVSEGGKSVVAGSVASGAGLSRPSTMPLPHDVR